MRPLFAILVLVFAVNAFAGSCPEGGGCCGGCDMKLVDAHVVEGTECPANEVMVGMPDMESVKCAKIKCSCSQCVPPKSNN